MYYNSWERFESTKEWKDELSKVLELQEWETVTCPACLDTDAQIGFRMDALEDIDLFVFSVFGCPECGLVIHDHNSQPFLAEVCLKSLLTTELERLKKEFGIKKELRLRWAPLELA